MKKKPFKIILITLIFIFFTNLDIYSEESQLILIKNERTSKVIGLLQEAKELLSEDYDLSEINLLSLLQRNLTKKYIVLNLYTENVEAKVEEFLNDTIYIRGILNPMPILIKKRKVAKESKIKSRKDRKKDTYKNIKRLNKNFLKDINNEKSRD